MKRVVPVISLKGGVGKSTFSRGLVDVARSAGIPTAAYDADGGVGQLLAHYGQRDPKGSLMRNQDAAKGVDYFDVRDEVAREMLVNVVDAKADLVVIDLPGGSMDAISAVVPGGLPGLLDTWVEEGWDVRVVHVITSLKACALEVLRVSETLGAHGASLRVAKNLGISDPNAFYIFEGDGNGQYGGPKAALLQAGGKVFEMPKIRSRTYTWVDEFTMQFSQAAVNEDEGHRGDRKWLREWLREFEAAIRDGDVL
jgi:hypothetical protein